MKEIIMIKLIKTNNVFVVFFAEGDIFMIVSPQ